VTRLGGSSAGRDMAGLYARCRHRSRSATGPAGDVQAQVLLHRVEVERVSLGAESCGSEIVLYGSTAIGTRCLAPAARWHWRRPHRRCPRLPLSVACLGWRRGMRASGPVDRSASNCSPTPAVAPTVGCYFTNPAPRTFFRTSASAVSDGRPLVMAPSKKVP
jgi:hypothetical protein